jgi:CBS domain-containing protein
VRDTSTVAEAALAMTKYRVHGLPVVSDENVLVGFLSSLDIVNWVAAN